jgi:hypothetical protein
MLNFGVINYKNMTVSAKQKTVFVLGAGASKELNLPTGDELKIQIAEELNIRFDKWDEQLSGSHDITQAFRILVQPNPQQRDINPYIDACRRISVAMPQAMSIDNFIDVHGEDKLVEVSGKLGIALSVLKAESKSKITFNRLISTRPNFTNLSSTWHNLFFQLLTENCKKPDLPKRLQKVALIIFNYDRCAEEFLIHSLKNYYHIQEEEALQLLKNVEIYHPYGVVGALPGLTDGTAIPFGATPQPSDLLAISKELKTFTEGTSESSSDIKRVKELMAKSQRIVFLGFAYHKLNLKLLFNKPTVFSPIESRKIYGTAFGISAADQKIITKELAEYAWIDQKDVELRNDLTCAQLFKEYSRSMSFN